MEPLDEDMPELETTTIIIHRFAAGDDHALAEYLSRHKVKFVPGRLRKIRHLKIVEAAMDGKGAVDLAFMEMCEKKRLWRAQLGHEQPGFRQNVEPDPG